MKPSATTNFPAGLRGMELLDTPIWNKGTAFDDRERLTLRLQGLLPPQVESLTDQSIRAYEALHDSAGSLLPRLNTIREVALDIAYAVGTKAQEEGSAPASEHQALRKKLTESQWFPEYTKCEL